MKYFYLLILLFSGFTSNAQTDVSWDFTTASPNSGVPVSNLSISPISQGNNNGTTTLITSVSASSGYTGASGTFNAGSAARVGALNIAALGSAYFEFTLTPNAGNSVSLNAINFGTRSTGTGPQAYSIRTSLDNYSSNATSAAIANNSTWSLKTNSTSITSASGIPLTVRIYGHNGAGSPSAGTANWRIDDLKINVTVTGSGTDITPPAITTFLPADNDMAVPINTALTITFNETIKKGTGTISVKKGLDNSVAQTIDVVSSAVSVSGSAVNITINTLTAVTDYYIEITPGGFKDLANNDFAGISDPTTWNFTTDAAVGVASLNANFQTCAPPSSITNGFTQFSVTGAQIWACTTFGRDPANPAGTTAFPNAVQINGFASGSNVINEDWLISPSVNLTSTTFPLLSFWSRTAFNGAPLKLRVSTNYSGTGNPNLATWTDLNGQFPSQTSNIWTLSQNINLAAFKTANTYIAFVYNSTDDDGARWTLDDIKIDNSLTPPPASLTPNTGEVNFGFVASGTNLVKTMTITGNDIIGPVTLNATGNFLMSKTNGNFTPSISFTQLEANNTLQTVYVQFTPTAVSVNYTGVLTISTPSVADTVIVLKGNSIDAATTLEVVNWNIEWFGSPSLGPTNDNQQEQNVKTILQNLGADVYALQEVVSESRLANVVSQMPGYSYVLSDFGSRTNPNQTGASPLSEAQKLGMIYKTSLFPGGVTTQALLSAGINSAADITNPAYNWFSSGRFPYMVTGTTTLNGITKTLRFVIVHAKANTSPTLTSYNRRKAGTDSLRINLNTFYPNDNIIMLGDFNDDLDSTITAGINPKLSSYKSFTDDAANFFSPTLALSLSGKKSTVSYNDVIDHVMISKEMECSYLPESANILTDVTSLVTSFGSSTTDHYPVFTRYLFVVNNNANITYSNTPFCSNAGIANVTLTGKTGGVFSSTSGLSISSTTGAINLAASTAGSYIVTYTLAATSACNSLFTTTAAITITTAANASISYPATPFCQGTLIVPVTQTGTSGGIFSSTAGLNINSTTGEINVAASVPGTYIVTYSLPANGGCSPFTTTTTVNINSVSVAPVSASASSTLICGTGGTVTLTANGGTLGTGATYKWYGGSCGGTIVGTGATISVLINSTTTFYVRAEGICNTTACASVAVTVAPQPVVLATVTPQNNGVTPNSPVTIVATVSPVDNYNFLWTKNDIINLPTNRDRIIVLADEAGNYKVKVTAPSGCTATSTSVFVPSAVSQRLFISANPNRGIFNVSFNNGNANLNGRVLNIYNNKGAKIFTQTYSNNVPFSNMRVNISQHAKGTYNVILNDATGKKLASGTVQIL